MTSIRDENALRTRCIPWLASTSCDNITRYGYSALQPLDESCVHQLIHGADAGRD